MRCDVNLSLAPAGTGTLGTRTETKNVNSLRSVERAVRYEMQRHAGDARRRRRDPPGDPALARGHRGHHQRPREVRRRGLPLLPRARPGAGRADPRVGGGAARHAAREPDRRSGPGCRPSGASPTSRCATPSAPARSAWSRRPSPPARRPQAARKWWLGELARRANEAGVEIADLGVTPADVARVQALVDAGTLNDKLARQVFDGLLAGEGTPDEIVAARGLAIVSDDGALGAAVDKAIAANPDVADKIRDGKVAAAGALIGAVMKEMRGQADAGRVRELILEKLT